MRRSQAPGRLLHALLLCASTGLAGPSAAQEESDPVGLLPQALDVVPVVDVRLRGGVDASRDLCAQPVPTTWFPVRGAVGVQAMALDRYGAKLTLGAAGALGDRAAEPELFLDEALVEIRLPWGDSLTQARIGRQAIEWLDGRLASVESFAQRPRRIDAIRLSAGLGLVDFDGFVAALDSQQQLADLGRNAPRAAGDYLGAAAASWHLGTVLTLEGHALGHIVNALAALDDPDIPGDERRPTRIATIGLSLQIAPAAMLQLNSTVNLQVGEARGLEHLAADAGSRLSLIGPWPGRPTLLLGYDFSSGASHPLSNRSTAFDAPLAAIHTRFGAADMLRPSNAQDTWIAARVSSEESSLALSGRRLALASVDDSWIDGSGRALVAAGSGATTLLGYEIDLEGNLKLAPGTTLELLYAMFVPDGMARKEVGPRTAHRLLIGMSLAY
ncbi:MAG: alginate export family protein [Deltaproteobacteria bacterium]|nr:alginate export family protein [Deltaproteobacteria bacterium]